MFRVDILDENLSKSTLSYWEIRYDFTAKVVLEAIFTLSPQVMTWGIIWLQEHHL